MKMTMPNSGLKGLTRSASALLPSIYKYYIIYDVITVLSYFVKSWPVHETSIWSRESYVPVQNKTFVFITFLQYWTDVGTTLYKYYANVLCLHVCSRKWKQCLPINSVYDNNGVEIEGYTMTKNTNLPHFDSAMKHLNLRHYNEVHTNYNKMYFFNNYRNKHIYCTF